MAQEQTKEEIGALLARFPVCITYVPVGTEVDFYTFCTIPETTTIYEIKPDTSLDPREVVAHAIETVQGRIAAILIPGRRFDASGTRHGKGAGWYDRFLAQVPASWTRIGFCFDDQFSDEPLVRESWDEPMDYVVVVPRDGRDPVLYTTGARN